MVSFQSEYGWTNSAELRVWHSTKPNQTIVSTYSLAKKNSLERQGGHVPTCPLAGDATVDFIASIIINVIEKKILAIDTDKGAERGGVWGGGVPLPTGGRGLGRGLCPLPRKFFDFSSEKEWVSVHYGKYFITVQLPFLQQKTVFLASRTCKWKHCLQGESKRQDDCWQQHLYEMKLVDRIWLTWKWNRTTCFSSCQNSWFIAHWFADINWCVKQV